MHKSKHQLYNKLVPTSLPENTGEFGKKYIYSEERRDMMACRYYYHSTICRLRYDDCLMQLSREFNLATLTIETHLKKRLAFLNTMVQEETTVRQLKKKYPWFVWDLPKHLPVP